MIKAIETEYNGDKFRSRLEAKWAVFFVEAGLRYVYEPEGLILENGTKYLPDFYLPDFDAYVEVKRDTPDGVDEVWNKSREVIKWGGPIHQIVILSDIPQGNSVDGGIWHFPAFYWRIDCVELGWWFFHGDETVNGKISRLSEKMYSSDHENRKTICAVSDYVLRHITLSGKELTDMKLLQESLNKRVFEAFKKARQARFEWGEKP